MSPAPAILVSFSAYELAMFRRAPNPLLRTPALAWELSQPLLLAIRSPGAQAQLVIDGTLPMRGACLQHAALYILSSTKR
jgi:hypothetical protein